MARGQVELEAMSGPRPEPVGAEAKPRSSGRLAEEVAIEAGH